MDDVSKVQKMTKKILVVDDDILLLKVIEEMIASAGYAVECEVSPAQAWEKLQQPHHQFSLIITDMLMPEIDGITFAERCKQTPGVSHLPVVMLTSVVGKPERVLATKVGIDDFLIKPVDRDLLLMVLDRLMPDVDAFMGSV